jgi:toxin secretion/phage lysis holin
MEEKQMVGILKILLAIGGTIVSFLFGAWHISLTILLIFMSIDFITGIAKGAYNKELRSARGAKGILKKGVMLLVIIMANLLDVLVSQGMPVFRTMAVYFYIGNEGISILENLGQMNVPIPKFIKKYLEQLKEKNDDKDNGNSEQ